MQFLFTALLAVLATCCFAQQTTTSRRPTIPAITCDISWATYCLKTYIDRYGFNSTNTGVFPDPATFDQAQSNYIAANGVHGLANGRTWWLALQTCLGPDSFPCLFDSNKLQQIFNTDSTTMDGTLWMITFFEEDFVNSPDAYKVGIQYYHCAVQVQNHYNNSIYQCQNTYFNDIQKDPKNICSYQVFYMTCLQTIYASNCAPALGGYVCNEAGIYLRLMNPACIENPPSNTFCYSLT
uniref:Uncharacterized protein n=1 Tax=Plectus sambesii TaxID=2011161 RepID=A0A914VRW2_9BILA